MVVELDGALARAYEILPQLEGREHGGELHLGLLRGAGALADAVAKGEAYPDPVRVVAIGGSVAKITSTPSSKDWSSLSVELCGGTHLRNTKDAVGFALLEEQGIAKGVRRLVACTREKAASAHACARDFRERIVAFESMPLDTSEAFAKAEETLKLLKVEVNAAVMPQHQKMFCREALNSHSSGPMKAARKKAEKAQADAASGAFEALAASNADGAVAARVDFGCDAKLWQKLQKSILAKKAPSGSFLVCSAGSGKVGVYVRHLGIIEALA